MTNRRDCPACERESPNENHGWICTRGAGCVEAAAHKPVAAVADDMDALAERLASDAVGYQKRAISRGVSPLSAIATVLCSDIQHLLADRDRLKAENATLRAERDEAKENVSLMREAGERVIARKIAEADALRARVAVLEEALDAIADGEESLRLMKFGYVVDIARAALGATKGEGAAAIPQEGRYVCRCGEIVTDPRAVCSRCN